MDEDRLKFSLHKVCYHYHHCHHLHLRCFFGCTRIHIWPNRVEEWPDEDGAEVFNDKDCPPWYLRSEIFDVYGALISEASGVNRSIFRIAH